MRRSPFFKQAELVLRVLPHVHNEDRFAIKGGTALNFFFLDMPRLSVDIDLTFLPITPRKDTLQDISDALEKLSDGIKRAMPDSRIEPTKTSDNSRITKLFVRREGALIKIEPNEIIRGSVFPCEERSLVKKAEDLFELSVSAKSLSIADLYGGKLCAALDRQHPRDLFDIKLLLENGGITDEIRKAFVIYLASHNRPMNELLEPSHQDFRQTFENDFKGIAAIEVTCDELIEVRNSLPDALLKSLTDDERRFLLSIKKGEPEWHLIGLEGIDRLPAIRWKVQNVQKMSREKHVTELQKLKTILNL
jgi:predicted nucleotidyltransferase component of viral defense system